MFHRTGATTEVNISHRSRQEILTTSNLACPDLFNNALNELIQLMKTVCVSLALCNFYWIDSIQTSIILSKLVINYASLCWFCF